MARGSGYSSEARPERAYYPLVDYLKALAILAVVFTHAGPPVLRPELLSMEYILRRSWVVFHVPTFFLISGFLYYSAQPIAARIVRRRLARIIPPYLVVSMIAYMLGLVPTEGDSFPFRLLIGSSIGVYYYIFDLVLLVLLTPLLSRLSGRGAALLLIADLAYLFLVSTWPQLQPKMQLLWQIRWPPTFLHFFLLGWVARAFLRTLSTQARTYVIYAAVIAGCVVVLELSGLSRSFFWWPKYAAWRMLYMSAVITLVYAAVRGRSAPAPVVYLSERTYAIFLYHILFIRLLVPLMVGWPVPVRVFTLVAAGVAGSCLLVATARRLLGQRSQTLVGA